MIMSIYRFIVKSGLVAILLALSTSYSVAQSIQQEKMAKLAFMVGEWVGMSTSYKEGKSSSVPAYESIQYKIDKHIITLDLLSDTLLIHTIIYFDDKDQTYYYSPYYKSGAGKYKGEYSDGKFTVQFNEKRRLTFRLTEDGHFQEYGENLIDGVWVKYFEDTLKPM